MKYKVLADNETYETETLQGAKDLALDLGAKQIQSKRHNYFNNYLIEGHWIREPKDKQKNK